MNRDYSWLEKLNSGDNGAYRELFSRYFSSLVVFAEKYIGDLEASKDIVQDSIFEFWNKKYKFDDPVSLEVYFYRTVRNKCLNVIEHNRVRAKYHQELSYKDESDFFLNSVLEEEVYKILMDAIESLPEQIRTTYDLTLLGHDNSEIAEIMGTTLDSVKSRKKRGKALLQEKLKDMMVLLIPFL